MDLHVKKIVYFETAGAQNTKTLLEVVKDYVNKENIGSILIATTTGKTGAEATKAFKGRNVIVVTHCYGFSAPGKFELKEEYKKEILANGAKIHTATHALSSVERAIYKEFGTLGPLELISNTLRLMGEGTKVCVEITLMAADAGLIPADEDVVAIAGTGNGADTALRIKPANTARFFDLKIKEVIAKPREF
ncbi:MAG: pyruvate kinase alpha/beta domain-containing protein [Candidatus Bathyarchaeales archaeon]